jgi:hypothetical protein
VDHLQARWIVGLAEHEILDADRARHFQCITAVTPSCVAHRGRELGTPCRPVPELANASSAFKYRAGRPHRIEVARICWPISNIRGPETEYGSKSSELRWTKVHCKNSVALVLFNWRNRRYPRTFIVCQIRPTEWLVLAGHF